MIYISVDNDYHGEQALSLANAAQLKTEDITFLSTISKRNTVIPKSNYRIITIEPHPLSAGNGYKKLKTYFKSAKHQSNLLKKINFYNSDTLIIMTEYQINNSIFAKAMKRAQGRVYLFDEGISFYYNNSPFWHSQRTTRNKIILLFYNFAFFILSLPVYAQKGFEDRMFICIKEKYIDKIFSKLQLPIARSIPVNGYRSTEVDAEIKNKKNKKNVIFFTTSLETFGLKQQDFELAEATIKKLSQKFENVLVKIHPSDWIAKNDTYNFYSNLSTQFRNVKIVDNSLSGNQAIQIYHPQIAVGTVTAVLFDALAMGCQPVFLFHLLPQVQAFNVCRFILNSINYNFIKNLDDITADYNCSVQARDFIYDRGPLSLK